MLLLIVWITNIVCCNRYKSMVTEACRLHRVCV